MRELLPRELPVDTFDDSAWIGITPFEVRGLRLRGTPPPPLVSRFRETNVRTYTTLGDAPGIYFFSLDASSPLAVAAARLTYRLPYYPARMALRRSGHVVHHESHRVNSRARLEVRYQPVGSPTAPVAGTLEHFLTERYRLYTVDRGRRVHAADIHHAPWALSRAAAEIATNTMAEPLAIEVSKSPALLHYSRRQDVLIWPLRRVDHGV